MFAQRTLPHSMPGRGLKPEGTPSCSLPLCACMEIHCLKTVRSILASAQVLAQSPAHPRYMSEDAYGINKQTNISTLLLCCVLCPKAALSEPQNLPSHQTAGPKGRERKGGREAGDWAGRSRSATGQEKRLRTACACE